MDARLYDHKKLKKLRLQKSLEVEEPITQKKLAEVIGVTRQTVSLAENGTRISIDMLIDLARFYRVNYKTLLLDDNFTDSIAA